ncbi:glycosyltransferase involved in cell wall biosynthesis [Caulobacter ginsengisoli]|uniref:Glycosyltransferase involved in cell wall biosynthesis n=1 Tax=Caulobacter ginsengisoli TaxID=400775 RepID=A0ABU0IM69_9CAUL|nr:glycosyltransferase [Caulobacter ginsengisoli]MDQ0463116.1 glycosyltransferase involved in cell wall biosynthesis [Caulobacter ginsengisoli]
MHRVRTSCRYYADHGWSPTVLAVRPEDCGRLIDERLTQTVPSEIRIVRTGAFPERWARPLGFSALAFRAWQPLKAAGDRLIREISPDLVYFSTTAFPVMALGDRWRRRFATPFVLDLHDPWYTTPPSATSFRRPGLKSRMMYAIHRRLEARAMRSVSGLIAVSDRYVPALETAYPRLEGVPRDTIPFGIEALDFEVARRTGKPVSSGFDRSTTRLGLYAGRVSDGMLPTLKMLLATLAAGADRPAIRDFRLGFLGTGYQLSGNPLIAAPLADEMGLQEVVREQPDRVSLMDSLSTLAQADVLLILGSEDKAYQPSKLFQYLATDRPILCVAAADAPFARQVAGLDSVFLLDSARPPQDQVTALADWLARAAGRPVEAEPGRQVLAEQFSARAMAARECALFDAALASAGTDQ